MNKMIFKCIDDNNIVHIECKRCGKKFVHLLDQPEPKCLCEEPQPTGGSVTIKIDGFDEHGFYEKKTIPWQIGKPFPVGYQTITILSINPLADNRMYSA